VRRSSGGKGAVLLSIVSSVLAIGLGYVAWQQWTDQHAKTAKLAQASAQLQVLAQARTRDQKSLSALTQLDTTQKARIAQGDAELSELKAKLGASEARLGELEAQSHELNERVAEFRSVTRQFQRMIDSGKLQINFRRGRMIVELPAAVLFASGSADLSDDGRKALQEVAKILRKVPGKRFMVGGHTDDVPVAKTSGGYTSNWSLSAIRAVTVTESLIDAGLRANHLVAAGYGEFDPIANNANDRGRQKNRRIEIVLEPELSGLPGALAGLEDKKAAAAPKKK
jgi:chemotaxis protein MotB